MIQRSHSNNISQQESEISILNKISSTQESKKPHFQQPHIQQISLQKSNQKHQQVNSSFDFCFDQQMQNIVYQKYNNNIHKTGSNVETSINQSPQNKVFSRKIKEIIDDSGLKNLNQISLNTSEVNILNSDKKNYIRKVNERRAESAQSNYYNDTQIQQKQQQNKSNQIISKNNQSNELKCDYKIFPQIGVKLPSIMNSEQKQQQQTQNQQNNQISLKQYLQGIQFKKSSPHCISIDSPYKSKNILYTESPRQQISTERILNGSKQLIKRSFDDIIKKINADPLVIINNIKEHQTEPYSKQQDQNDNSLNKIVYTENINSKFNDLLKFKPKSQIKGRGKSAHSYNQNIPKIKVEDLQKQNFQQDKLVNYISFKFNQIDKYQANFIHKDEIIHFFENSICNQNNYIEFEQYLKNNFSVFVLGLVERQTEKAGLLNFHEFKSFLREFFSKLMISKVKVEDQNNNVIKQNIYFTVDNNLQKRQFSQKVRKFSNDQKILSLKRIYSEQKNSNEEIFDNQLSNQNDNSFQQHQPEYRSQLQKKQMQFKQIIKSSQIGQNTNNQNIKQIRVNKSLNINRNQSNQSQNNYSFNAIDNDQSQSNKQPNQNEINRCNQNQDQNSTNQSTIVQNTFKQQNNTNKHQKQLTYQKDTYLSQSHTNEEQQQNNDLDNQNNTNQSIINQSCQKNQQNETNQNTQTKSNNYNKNYQSIYQQNINNQYNYSYQTPIKTNCFLDDKLIQNDQTIQDQNLKSFNSTDIFKDKCQLSQRNDKFDQRINSAKPIRVFQNQDKDKNSSLDKKIRSQSFISDINQQDVLIKKNSSNSNEQNEQQSQQNVNLYKQTQKRYDNYYLKYSKESKNNKNYQIKNNIGLNQIINNELGKNISINQLIKINKAEDIYNDNGDQIVNDREKQNKEDNIDDKNQLKHFVKQNDLIKTSSQKFSTPEKINNSNFEQTFSKINECLNLSDNQFFWNIEQNPQQSNHLDFTKTSSFASNQNIQNIESKENIAEFSQRKQSSPAILDEQDENQLAFGNKINTRIRQDRQQNQRLNQFGISGSLLLRQYKTHQNFNQPQNESPIIQNQNDLIIEQSEQQTEQMNECGLDQKDNLKNINLECTFRPHQIEEQLNLDSPQTEQQHNNMKQLNFIKQQQTDRQQQDNEQIIDNFSFNPNQINFKINPGFIIPNSQNEQEIKQNNSLQQTNITKSDNQQRIKELDSNEFTNQNKSNQNQMIKDEDLINKQISEQSDQIQNTTRKDNYIQQISNQSADKATQRQDKIEEIKKSVVNDNKSVSNITSAQNTSRDALNNRIDQNCQNFLKKKEVRVLKKGSSLKLQSESTQKQQKYSQNNKLNINFNYDILPQDVNNTLNQITFGSNANIVIDLNQNIQNQLSKGDQKQLNKDSSIHNQNQKQV